MPRAPLAVREPEAGWWEAQDEVAVPTGQPGMATVTVAVVHDRDAAGSAETVAARLATLAVDDELLVVFGQEVFLRTGHDAMIAALRGHLPRHHVIALEVGHRPDEMARHMATLGQFLEAGSLPVVVTSADGMHDITAEIASYLRADRVLRVFRTGTGADLYQVWRRRPELAVI